MGLFDKFTGGGTDAAFTPPEAFAAVLLAVIAADGDISDEERDDFVSRVNRMKLFQPLSGGQFSAIIDRLVKILRKSGSTELAQRGALALPAELKPTAFAVVADMVFADGEVDEAESALVEKLQRDLGISDDMAAKVVEVLSIKNAG